MTTQELDNLAAETAATMTTDHADYAVLGDFNVLRFKLNMMLDHNFISIFYLLYILAARIAISNLHKETKKQFSEVMDDLFNMENEYLKTKSPMISDYHHKIIMQNADQLNSAIIYDRDFGYNYFG